MSDSLDIFSEREIISGAPAHFGNPLAEEAALREGQAFTCLSSLQVLRLTGEDCRRWLHSLSTCDVQNMEEGESREMLLLDPQGHINHAAFLQLEAEAIYLFTDREKIAALEDFLQKMKFRMRVEISRLAGAVFGFIDFSEEIAARIEQTAQVLWKDPWPQVLAGGAHYGVPPAMHPAAGRRRWLAFYDEKSGAAARMAWANILQPAGLLAWEAVRITDWRPRALTEVCGPVFPHELDWLRTALHSSKGCYCGQEAVAKLINLGRVPRRLTYLYLEAGAELPSAGAKVYAGGKEVGILTSVTRSYLEGAVGLALLKRSVPVDQVLEVAENIAAAQQEIVSQSGKSSISPAERPGKELRQNALRRGGRKNLM